MDGRCLTRLRLAGPAYGLPSPSARRRARGGGARSVRRDPGPQTDARRRPTRFDVLVGIITPGFGGRPRSGDVDLPPGQYLTSDFPVLSAGPTPRVDLDEWKFEVATEAGDRHAWSWSDLQALPRAEVTVDLHCVTGWSKLGTPWTGVSGRARKFFWGQVQAVGSPR